MKSLFQEKHQKLYLLLAGIFLTNAIVAELIGVKIFSVENLLGFESLNFAVTQDFSISFNMSVGILIWPVVFILSDIINEYFGKPGVRRISYMAAGLIAYSFVIIFSGTQLPPADFWLQLNNTDPSGNPFDINFAYSTIFRQGMGIIIGSITAFLVGQLVDMYAFHYIRKITANKYLWLRATGSTMISQLIDSFLILLIAFYWLGNWSFLQVLAVGFIQYIYKIGFAIILTPVIYWMHHIIDSYLGKEKSEELIMQATIDYQQK